VYSTAQSPLELRWIIQSPPSASYLHPTDYWRVPAQAKSIAEEFLVDANEEQGHADQIAGRVVPLGGEPDFSPDSLMSRSHAENVEGGSLEDLPPGLE